MSLKKMILNRDHTHTSLKGHSVEFKKGEPVNVPVALYQEVLAIGAVDADGSDPDVQSDNKNKHTPRDPAERNPLILMAIEDLVAKNDRGDFTAAGLPKAAAVSKVADFKVEVKEIEAVWNERNEKLAIDKMAADKAKK